MESPDLSFTLADEYSDAWDEKCGTESIASYATEFMDFLRSGVELTDAMFFEFLKNSPSTLAHPLFQSKINSWQSILQSTNSDSRGKIQAKLRLQYIGVVLSMEYRGRKPQTDDDEVANLVLTIQKELNKFWVDVKNSTNPSRIYQTNIKYIISDKFKYYKPELTGYLISEEAALFVIDQKKSKACSLYSFSKNVVAEFLEISSRSVEKSLKNTIVKK